MTFIDKGERKIQRRRQRQYGASHLWYVSLPGEPSVACRTARKAGKLCRQRGEGCRLELWQYWSPTDNWDGGDKVPKWWRETRSSLSRAWVIRDGRRVRIGVPQTAVESGET